MRDSRSRCAIGRIAGALARHFARAIPRCQGACGDEFEPRTRCDTEAGYGLGAPLGVVTPYVGFSLAGEGERSWHAGARWRVAPGASLSLEGTRCEAANDAAPEHDLMLRGSVRW